MLQTLCANRARTIFRYVAGRCRSYRRVWTYCSYITDIILVILSPNGFTCKLDYQEIDFSIYILSIVRWLENITEATQDGDLPIHLSNPLNLYCHAGVLSMVPIFAYSCQSRE